MYMMYIWINYTVPIKSDQEIQTKFDVVFIVLHPSKHDRDIYYPCRLT